MADNRYKEKHMETPIENWITAPLAYIREQKPESMVAIPSEEDMRNAKDWVDANQK